MKVRGIELRYLLTHYVHAHGPMTVGELVAMLTHHGFETGGRASKVVSDALRWEVGRGRIYRLAKARVGPGWMPRATEYRIHQRVMALRNVAACQSEVMPEETATPRLTAEFDDALKYAAQLHRTQTRKASDVPYLGHLLSVAGLVIEAGGTQTQAIAALLHDAAEDQGGEATLAEIRDRFGADVAKVVAECSDTFEDPKPPWQERKQRYIDHLDDASDDTILVSLADKLDNARAILRDFRDKGPELWQRFSVDDPFKHLWYYRSLLAVYERRNDTWLVNELRRVLDTLEELVASPTTANEE